MPRSYVTGQRSKPCRVMGNGALGIVLVSLYPWGLAPLFPGSVAAPDDYTDLRLLVNAGRVRRLEDDLLRARSTRERVSLVESFLLRIRHPTFDARMARACQLFSNHSWERPLRQTAGALGMSERHLSRSFKTAIGLRPNVFLRIMRFQRALRLHRRLGMPWAEVAASCGFSDQAHLVHEMRQFAGSSPGRILLKDRPATSAFNGQGVSRFFDTVYA